MKTVVLIFASYVLLSLTNNTIDNDKIIVWNQNRKLTFNDYLKPVPANATWEMAATTVTIECLPKNINGKIVFTTRALFSKEGSWFKPEAKNNINVLNHEQLHFDIAELYARILRKYLITGKNYKAETGEDADKMKVIISNNLRAEETENARYDVESNHGRNKEKQHQWEQDVANRMKELEAYR